MPNIPVAVILFILSAVLFFLGIRSFRERGFLLNNAFLYASKKQRETMDKKPYYRQTAVVFFLLGAVFLLNGLAVLWNVPALSYAATAVVVIAVIYAAASGIVIEKRKRQP